MKNLFATLALVLGLMAPPLEPNTEGECLWILGVRIRSINMNPNLTPAEAYRQRMNAWAEYGRCIDNIWPPKWWKDAMDALEHP